LLTDNAPTESFFNSLKTERVHGTHYETRSDAKADLFEYTELFYNRSRRHSALGGKSPAIVYDEWVMQQSWRLKPALKISENMGKLSTTA
jgi:putative transposase